MGQGQRGSTAMVELLLAHKADVNVRNKVMLVEGWEGEYLWSSSVCVWRFTTMG